MNFLKNPSTDPYFNMAFDEYCLVQKPFDSAFFYIWRNRPSVIVGVNQDVYNEVNLEYLAENDISLVRRVTGGGAVYHDLQNVNYSIVRPLGSDCSCSGVCGSSGIANSDSDGLDDFYSPSVEIFAAALRELGIDAQLSGRNDIFVDGLKISGYARRIHKNMELVHGTLMYNVDIQTLTNVLDTPSSKLHRKGVASVRSRVGNVKELIGIGSVEDLMASLYSILGANSVELSLSQSQLAEISELAATKFATKEWIYRHSF